MGNPSGGSDRGHELVMMGIPGVQTFISEAQSTSDLANASDVIARVARTAVDAVQKAGGELVIPASLRDDVPTPNRIVALVPEGRGRAVAEGAAAAVRERWDGWVRTVLGRDVEVPGFPEVMWSVAGPGDYPEQWQRAGRALAARKRLRAFDAPEFAGRQPCPLAPRWPAEDAPEGVPQHMKKTRISAAGWVKRRWHALPGLPSSRSGGFPSTASIASAPYRAELLGLEADAPRVGSAVERLREAAEAVTGAEYARVAREAPIPALAGDGAAGEDAGWAGWLARSGGVWVHPGTWQEDGLGRDFGFDGHRVDRGRVEAGRRAAEELSRLLGKKPTPYYALLTSDIDGMGDLLSEGEVSAERHREISARLQDFGAEQRRIIEKHGGVAVYTGGDDLFALLPADSALQAARECRDKVPPLAGHTPTASTAVLFAHQHRPLRPAVQEVQELLADAKRVDGGSRKKDGLAVGVATGSGRRVRTVRPWRGGAAVDALKVFASHHGGDRVLSPGLLADLQRDRAALEKLAASSLGGRVYAKEVDRLVRRHGGTSEEAEALVEMGRTESERGDSGDGRLVPVEAARVALFLRREAW